MTKKAKIWTSFGIVSTGSLLLFGILLMFYNPFLAPTMVKYYSDDSHFHRFRGTLSNYYSETRGIGWLKFKTIESLDGVTVRESYKHLVTRIYSPNLQRTWDALNPKEDLEIEFYATFEIFYDGCPPAIIQITVGDEEILTFYDGKTVLIEWASHAY